jgi:hypothetical protein
MNEPKPIYVLKLLHIIRYHLDLDELIDLGLEYYHIAKILSYCINSDFVKDSDDGLVLTELGLEQLEKINKQLYPSNSHPWIMPSEENRIPKIDKFEIYLPRIKKC